MVYLLAIASAVFYGAADFAGGEMGGVDEAPVLVDRGVI